MKTYQIPLIARGQVIFDDMVTHKSRISDFGFATPEPSKYLKQIVLADCNDLSDLHQLSLDEIIDFLGEFGERLRFDKNPYLQEAFEISKLTSNLPDKIVRTIYDRLPGLLNRQFIEEMIDAQIGREYLESWVPYKHMDGRIIKVRAFGSRSAHIIPGNVPMAAVTQIMRGAITRGDTILKAPSNDPATASAVARTLVDIDPNHPVTRHVVAAYWKGGDATIEGIVYRPQFIDKMVVWGGESSIKHARQYLQPGLLVHPFDPKYSNSIIGRETFNSDEGMREAAKFLAADIGGLNQEGCVNSRITYVESGTTAEGIRNINKFGEYVYEAMMQFEEEFSSASKVSHPEMEECVSDLDLYSDEFRVIGEGGLTGAIIVSQSDVTVEFADLLEGRTANLVPVDDVDTAIRRLNHFSQTIGVYPDSLRERVRDKAALFGAQRVTSLGYATAFTVLNRNDAVEPLRESCRWVIDEDCVSDRVAPPWENLGFKETEQSDRVVNQ